MKTRFLFSALLLAAQIVLIEAEPARVEPPNTNFVSIHLLETNLILSGLFMGEAPFPPIAIVNAPLNTNLISFHLLANDFPCGSLTGETPMPSKIRIVDEPLLSDADLITWNQAKHTFTIALPTFKRMADKWSTAQECSGGIPFVLVAGGSPIYVGAIGSWASSVSTVVPTAICHPDVTWERIDGQTNFTTNVTFQIDRNYPWDEPAGGPWDPRNDQRIVAAVEKLFGKQTDSKPEMQSHQNSGTNTVSPK